MRTCQAQRVRTWTCLWRNFSDVNLSCASFISLNLSGATFQDAIMANALLTRANLSGAGFLGANLTGARLMNADLTGAHFLDANLKKRILLVRMYPAWNFLSEAPKQLRAGRGCECHEEGAHEGRPYVREGTMRRRADGMGLRCGRNDRCREWCGCECQGRAPTRDAPT